ncbi:MAG: VOC family protein [Gammaproteobacteria bacterium]|nr:VOC family protein [Gammaproteobacteria bacterium]
MTNTAVRNWHHTSLAVKDLSLAANFYQQAFGFEVQFEERGMQQQIEQMTGVSGLACDIAQLRSPCSNHVLELVAFNTNEADDWETDPEPIRPGMAHVAFYVDDLEAAATIVEDLGAVRLGEVTDFSDGRSVYYREPAGSFFEMEELDEDS